MPDVVKVTLNNETLIDISDSTVEANKVLNGYVGYEGDGDRFVGTASGGGGTDLTHWQRPSGWPDYSQLDMTNEEAIYLTYKTNEPTSVAMIDVVALSNSSSITVETGTLTNGVFTARTTETFTGGFDYFRWFTGYSEDYAVVRISGGVKWINLNNVTYDDTLYPYHTTQYCVEIYGRLPSGTNNGLTELMLRSNIFCRSLTLLDMNSLTSLLRVAGDALSLENFYVSGTDPTKNISLYFAFANCRNLRYAYFNGMHTQSVNNAFKGCYRLRYTDVEDLVVNTTDPLNSVFESCRELDSLDLSGWSATCASATSAFAYCSGLKSVTLSENIHVNGSMQNGFRESAIESVPAMDYSGVTNFNYMFYTTNLTGDVDFTDMPVATIDAWSYNRAVRSITLPDTVTQINANAFRDCYSLREVHLTGTTVPTLSNVNAFTTNNSSELKIYVPYSEDHSVLAAYQAATNWSSLTNLVEEDPS